MELQLNRWNYNCADGTTIEQMELQNAITGDSKMLQKVFYRGFFMANSTKMLRGKGLDGCNGGPHILYIMSLTSFGKPSIHKLSNPFQMYFYS